MDIDPDFEIHLDSGFGVRLFGLGVASLMVALFVGGEERGEVPYSRIPCFCSQALIPCVLNSI